MWKVLVGALDTRNNLDFRGSVAKISETMREGQKMLHPYLHTNVEGKLCKVDDFSVIELHISSAETHGRIRVFSRNTFTYEKTFDMIVLIEMITT